MATLGLTEAERESIERFERNVVQPSMTALLSRANPGARKEVMRYDNLQRTND